MTPSLSVILPVFNRANLLAHPLASLRAAAAVAPGLEWELIVMDDGSTEDIAAALAPFADLPIRFHRQKNRGLLAARLAGLALARHEAIFFLDGDDAVAPGKFTAQLPALGDADVVYGDVARSTIDGSGHSLEPLRADAPQPSCTEPAEFYLAVQPAPHNPIFRRSYLQSAVAAAFFPADRAYDSIAETWFYYQLSVRPARIVYAPGAWSIVGEPAGERLSRKWERQAAASLRLMRAFLRHCPPTADTAEARRRVGLCAFATWRALPNGFPPAGAFLELWRQAPPSPRAALGGAMFARATRVLGPATAGRLFKLAQRPSYRRIRTVDDPELAALFSP